MNTQNQQNEYWLNLIIDRFTGAISEESDLHLQGWIDVSEENKLYSENLHKLWDSLNLTQEAEQYDQKRAFQLFRERISTEEIVTAESKKTEKPFTLWKRFFYAAALIPFLLLSYFSYCYFVPKEKPLVSEIVVPNGSKTFITLQDGSKVWLNAGSRLQYDSDFGEKFRNIKLSGEAYLEVARNEKCPFIVNAGEVKVKVLGTRFNINAYTDNNEIKVALIQGSVEMETSGGKTLQLTPDDIACFNIASRQIQVSRQGDYSQNLTGWINNRLIFNGENFEQISQILERNFNVKINIHKKTVKDRCFIGDFVNNETIEQIFNVMSSDGKFSYAIKGNMIDVY